MSAHSPLKITSNIYQLFNNCTLRINNCRFMGYSIIIYDYEPY